MNSQAAGVGFMVLVSGLWLAALAPDWQAGVWCVGSCVWTDGWERVCVCVCLCLCLCVCQEKYVRDVIVKTTSPPLSLFYEDLQCSAWRFGLSHAPSCTVNNRLSSRVISIQMVTSERLSSETSVERLASARQHPFYLSRSSPLLTSDKTGLDFESL